MIDSCCADKTEVSKAVLIGAVGQAAHYAATAGSLIL